MAAKQFADSVEDVEKIEKIMGAETIHPGKLAAFVKGCTQEFKSQLRDYLVSKYPLVGVLCYADYAGLTSNPFLFQKKLAPIYPHNLHSVLRVCFWTRVDGWCPDVEVCPLCVHEACLSLYVLFLRVCVCFAY